VNHAKTARSSLLLVLAVLAALAVASRMYFGRLDVSEGRIFTLSDYSRHVVETLEDPVTVKVFFSEDVGPQYNQNRVYIRDILEDYKSWSNGNFDYEMVDPRDKEGFEAEARKYRIQPVQAQAVENDQLTVKLVYMGLAFLAGEKTETLPFLADVGGLEYTITGTIRRLTVDALPVVGVLQGHGEPPLQPAGMPGMPGAESGLSTLSETLGRDYRVQPVDLAAVETVDPSVSTLLWIAPRDQVSPQDLYKVDQFLMRGGRLGLFLDGVEAELQTRQATPVNTGLAEFFAHYGLKLNANIVADARCGSVQMRQGGGGLMSLFAISLKYPPFVEVRDFDAGVADMFAMLASVAPWTGTQNQLASCPQGSELNFGIRDVKGHTEALVANSSDGSLVPPSTSGDDALEETLASVALSTHFQAQRPLTRAELSQLLWAGYGPTPHVVYQDHAGLTAPSAYAAYYLTRRIYVVAEKVLRYANRVGTDLFTHDHRVEVVAAADRRVDFRRQVPTLPAAPAYVVLCLAGESLDKWYRWLEAGFVAGNVLVQSTALGLGCALESAVPPVRYAAIRQLLSLPADDHPIAAIAVGQPV